ncbi:MAG: ABC transporter ATP-binding protein [Chloroflexi bacterium]|nr:ABC transporter ATP-binding protein [Chloroflexota bacterium]
MKLVAESLSLSYHGRPVVEGASFALAAGELVAIVGANGSGKSTLLSGLAALKTPDHGRVLLDGRDVRCMDRRDLARHLAVLHQFATGGLDLTVRDLASRGRYPHRGPFHRETAEDRLAVERALTLANASVLADRKLGSLSGGERQRAWIALALAQEPEVLVLDEPAAWLDLKHESELMHLLRQLCNRGVLVVAVMHELLLATRFADRVIALAGGRIVFDGRPAEFLDPAFLERVFGVPMTIVRGPDGLPMPVMATGPACEAPALDGEAAGPLGVAASGL